MCRVPQTGHKESLKEIDEKIAVCQVPQPHLARVLQQQQQQQHTHTHALCHCVAHWPSR